MTLKWDIIRRNHYARFPCSWCHWQPENFMRTQFIKAAAQIESEPLAIACARLGKGLLGTALESGESMPNP